MSKADLSERSGEQLPLTRPRVGKQACKGGRYCVHQADRVVSCLCSNALLIIILGDDGETAAYEVLHPDVNEPLVGSATSYIPPSFTLYVLVSHLATSASACNPTANTQSHISSASLKVLLLA